MGVTVEGASERIEEVVGNVGLPRGLPKEAAPSDIMSYLALDKKVRDGRTRFVLLSQIGVVYFANDSWSHPVEEQLVLDVVDSFAMNR